MKMDFETKDGFLVMNDLPHDCIFNKVKTGCGATTIAIKNAENYVIAVPTTEIIENKCYPIEQSDKWSAQSKKAGLSPVRNLFGLYGNFTKALKDKLKEYLKGEGTKKIICTYNKIPKLIELINPKDFHLLVDEYHHFLKSYLFRDKAINGVLEHFRDFKSFCFMSATPIPEDFQPVEFEDIEYKEVDWKDVETIQVLPYHTNKPYMIVTKIIKAYQENGFIEVNGQKSKEAYFFVNSVTEIKKILTQAELKDDDCRIICAKNGTNEKTLGTDYHISSSTDQSKKFNFITSKSFEGVDYFSETGLCFIVSNSYSTHTLLSIEMDIPQIAGRIRTKENPFRNKLVHIFNTRSIDTYDTYKQMERDLERQLQYAKERVQIYAHLSKGAKEQQRKEIEKSASYIKYDKKTDSFTVNDMLIKIKLYNHKIMYCIYKSGYALKKEYERSGMKANAVKWETVSADYIDKAICTPTFRECLKRYIELKEKNLLFGEIDEIESRYPFLREAIVKLGIPTLKRQRSIKAIKVLLENQ